MGRLAITGVGLCLLATGAAAEPVPLSLEDTVSLNRVTSVHLAPGGEDIAYLLSVPRQPYVDEDGAPFAELHVVDREGESRPYVTGEVEIGAVAWSADGSSLFFTAKRDPEAEFPALYEIRLDGGEAVLRYQHVNAIGGIFPSPDGSHLAFLAPGAPPALYKQLEEKGFKAVVYEESVLPVQVWMLDLESGEALAHDLPGSASAFAWAPGGDRYAVALAPTPLVDDSYVARDIFVADATSGEVLSRLGSTGKLGAFAWSPDGRHIAYVGSTGINDPREGRLYVASAAGGEPRDLLPGYPGHVTDLSWADAGRVRYLGARRVWTELGTASLGAAALPLETPRSGPILRSFDARAGSSTTAAVGEAPSHPPEVFLIEDGRAPQRLTDSNPWLADRLLGRQEAITYAARDGLELDAILIHPVAQARREERPLVIFVHGGPEAHYSNGWMATYSRPAHTLAARGYAIVYPNYRGSTGRGVEFSKLSQHDYAEEEFDDLVDARNTMIERGLARAGRVGISGGSYGGYATMWAASALTEHFDAAVAFVGISDHVSKFGTTDIPREMYRVHSRAWPWEDWLWMLERSPVYHAGRTRTPLLIMAGAEDPRVHPSQSLEMYRHVKLRSQAPVRLVLYPGEKHGNERAAARLDYAMRLVRWLDHYLLGEGGAPPRYQLDHAARLEAVQQEAAQRADAGSDHGA